MAGVPNISPSSWRRRVSGPMIDSSRRGHRGFGHLWIGTAQSGHKCSGFHGLPQRCRVQVPASTDIFILLLMYGYVAKTAENKKFTNDWQSAEPVSSKYGGDRVCVPFATEDGGTLGAHALALLKSLAEYAVASGCCSSSARLRIVLLLVSSMTNCPRPIVQYNHRWYAVLYPPSYHVLRKQGIVPCMVQAA